MSITAIIENHGRRRRPLKRLVVAREVAMWDKLLEALPYWFRPLKFCRGRSCYVMTANRKNGVPYCHSCDAENNAIAP
jgi:hypothetical protein